jgi:hypothetical protein
MHVSGARQVRRARTTAWHRGPAESFRVALEGQIRCLEFEDFKPLQAAAGGRTPQWRGR